MVPWRPHRSAMMTCTSPASHRRALLMNASDCFLICEMGIMSSLKSQVCFSSEELMGTQVLNCLVSYKNVRCSCYYNGPSSVKKCWELSLTSDG